MKKLIFLIFILISVASHAQPKISIDFKKNDSIFNSNLGKDYLEFTANTMEGRIITNKDLLGKVTLINFWMKGCSPCMVEFEFLNELYSKHKTNSRFQIISFTKDSKEIAQEIIDEYKILFTTIPVSPSECRRLNLNQGFPVNIIVNKQGKIIYLKMGGSINKEKSKEDVLLFETKMLEALL